MDDLKIMTGGAFAGLAQIVTGHPFDTVKVRYIKNKHKYRGVLDCVKTIRSEGYLRFYRGVSSPMVGSVIMNVQTFYLYSWFRRYFNGNPFLSGSLTGLVLSLTESPIDLIKSRMQITSSTTSTQTIKTIGIRNIYKGLGITSLRNIFAVGGFFWGYDLVKKSFENHYVGAFVGGSAAGFMCWGPVYPLDNIKTRIQTDTKNQYNGIIDCVKKVWKRSGFRGFWNGFSPCVVRGMVVNPFVFLAYEVGIQKFQ